MQCYFHGCENRATESRLIHIDIDGDDECYPAELLLCKKCGGGNRAFKSDTVYVTLKLEYTEADDGVVTDIVNVWSE